MRKPSYKARRLAKLLEAALQPHYPQWKLTIDPEEIYPALGWYRTSPQADCLRWEAVIRLNGSPMGDAESWHTMTECQHGIEARRANGLGSGVHDWDISPASSNTPSPQKEHQK